MDESRPSDNNTTDPPERIYPLYDTEQWKSEYQVTSSSFRVFLSKLLIIIFATKPQRINSLGKHLMIL